ncbi:hypothetical protein GQ44DRAFT_768328 [Phaeosphaeriaceae sp. PMI808]|nr:hypothetical protein GQ44DRAFT_768328 [Phaeosphaeriaceae sp. PMI808]
MRVFTSMGMLGMLQVCLIIGETFASPTQKTLVELRIKRDVDETSMELGSIPFLAVRDVFLRDMDFSHSDHEPNSTTIVVLEHLLAIQRQKREGAEFMRRSELEKRQTFGGRKQPGDDCKKKKYKKCSGIYEMYWDEKAKKCDLCPAGKKPTETSDKCIDQDTPEQEKERGKCPPGMKLDPSVPGQNENTLNPKCVNKDDKNSCPEGHTQSSATKKNPGKCAPDPEPNKKCDNKDLEPFKEIGADGKMKTTCRTTRERETKKKSTATENSRDAGRKAMEPEVKKQQERRNRENKARARRSACLALGAMTFLPEADVQALGEAEIEGLIEPDAKSIVPEIDLEDYMITLRNPVVAKIVMETAGPNFGSLIKLLFKIGRGGGGKAAQRPNIPRAKPARLFGGNKEGSKVGSGIFNALRSPKSYINTKRAGQASKDAAKNSGAAQNILKSKTFQECLAVGAGVALDAAVTKRQQSSNKYENGNVGGNVKLTIDLSAKKQENFPSPQDEMETMMVVADDITDGGDDEEPNFTLMTYSDGYNRDDRLYYESCTSLKGYSLNNKITLLQTWNGCCNYYNGENCEKDTIMFSQSNREDGQLRGKDNDAVSSFWCTFKPDCAGGPK